MSTPRPRSELRRVFGLLGVRAWAYFGAVLISAGVLAFSFNMVLAFIKKDVLDAAVAGQQALLTRALVLAAVTFLTGLPLLIGARYVIAYFEKRALTRARVQAFRKVVNLQIQHFDQQHSADLISRTTNDLNTLGQIFSQLLPNLCFGLLLGLVGVISILVFNWQLGLFALALGLVTLASSTLMARPLRIKSGAIQEALSENTRTLTDLLQSLPVAKMFHLEAMNEDRYVEALDRTAGAQLDHARSEAVNDALNALIGWLRTLGTLIFGLYLFARGNLGLGAIVAAIHLQGNASFLFTNLGNFVTGIQRSLAGAGRVFELLDWPAEDLAARPEPAAEAGSPVPGGGLALRDLSFRYESNGLEAGPTLQRVTLDVRGGEFVALVGPSGCGKSTLLKILMGLYPATQGQVLIHGRPLGSYALDELRSLMAYVPQDAYLFDGTIEENIRYGRPGASHAEVVAAAQSAYAHDFILEQPQGYETLVGERGARLSGGQRQRIAIARALLKDAPILLLDEATSALDSESEAIVQRALERLMQGRTTIAVAHRLSTIQHADRIYVLQSGSVVEQGSHDELLSSDGLYRQLLTLQDSQAG